ncbi:unnamed protein product [Ambrosiozyma monospora]|uniref:Unnamed protein product n=1 Tax=Ambrosiozyma monospora TaxID=43982 RepID=A0A9W6YW34_AMBMO|nr:unnamed protein product [Ambrosiozyma monospora]
MNTNNSFFIVETSSTGVASVKFNRPQKLNCFNELMWKEYKQVLTSLDSDSQVKVITISGEGQTFCSGLDLAFFAGKMQGQELRSKQDLYSFIKNFQDCVSTPLHITKPTIGVIHGTKNYGLALELIQCFTIRIFTKDSEFSLNEIDHRIIPDLGILQRLTKQTQNVSLLSRLALTAAKFGVDEVIELGLCSNGDVTESLEDGLRYAMTLAEKIADNPHWCVSGIKECIDDINEGNQSVAQGLDKVIWKNVKHIVSKL